MSVGENIKLYRQKKQLTQKQLGDLCNIAESTIRRYELGKLNPKYETLQKIALALDTHPLVLLDQISDQLSANIATDDDNVEKAFIVLLKSIYEDFDIEQVRDNGSISYNYILGSGKSKITISELTYTNMFEAVENLIKTYINTAKEDFSAQECYSLTSAMKDMTLDDIKALTKYAMFLNARIREYYRISPDEE